MKDAEVTAQRHRLHRVLLSGVGFIAYEALFIWILGDRFYDFSYASFWMSTMIAGAGAGYFALGYFSRSWLSGLLLAVPLLIAVYFVNDVWSVEYGDGGSSVIIRENANFAQLWLTLSLVFVPAWVLGVLTAKKQLQRE